MALSNANAQQATPYTPNEYCTELFTKIASIHQLVQNNLQHTANTRTKDIPYYFSLNDEVFLFSPVLSKKHTKKL